MEQDLFEAVQNYRAAARKAEAVLVNLQGGVDPDRVAGFTPELVELLTGVTDALAILSTELGDSGGGEVTP